MMHHHFDHWREGAPRAWEWGAVVASISGGVASVRDSVHSLAGLWGDCAGAVVALLTIILLSFRVNDAYHSRKGRPRRRRGESVPPPLRA